LLKYAWLSQDVKQKEWFCERVSGKIYSLYKSFFTLWWSIGVMEWWSIGVTPLTSQHFPLQYSTLQLAK
jgi:hypothetical protein